MNELISIIIPVFNVAPLLERCLQSVHLQEYTNLEIILVDDGSNDGSGDICDAWAKKDPRIRVLHQANGGPSLARNAGVAAARGAYISFVDADDYVADNMIALLYRRLTAQKADMAIGNFYYVSSDGKRKRLAASLCSGVYSGRQAAEDLFYQRGLEASPCGRLYRSDIVRASPFPEHRCYEDLGNTYKYYLQARTVVYCAEPVYYYVYRADSLSSRPFDDMKMDAIVMARSLYEDVCCRAPELGTAAACRLLSMCFHILFKTPCRSVYEKDIFALIKEHRCEVYRDAKARTVTRVMALLSYGGPGVLRCIYNINRFFKLYAGRESYR